MEPKEELEAVIQNLSEMLKVDRSSLARAISQLLARPAQSKEETLASRAGLQIINLGPAPVHVKDTDTSEYTINAETDRWFMPQQFPMKPAVQNAPYQALGMLASTFLYLSVSTEKGKTATVCIDWTKMFNNSGLWGNPRLVIRAISDKGAHCEHAEELSWKVELGERLLKLELFAIGLGLDAKGLSPVFPAQPVAPLRAQK